MVKIRILFLFVVYFFVQASTVFSGNILNISIAGQTKGLIKVELYPDLSPNHVERIKYLAGKGFYDNVVFHRVIEGFMAQTGDVKYGNKNQYYPELVGQGGSSLPDLRAEFSKKKFLAGTMGMARSSNPDSANSQFFIMFKDAPHLNNKYTIVGKLVVGMDVLLRIKRGNIKVNGLVENPDYMEKVFIEN